FAHSGTGASAASAGTATAISSRGRRRTVGTSGIGTRPGRFPGLCWTDLRAVRLFPISHRNASNVFRHPPPRGSPPARRRPVARPVVRLRGRRPEDGRPQGRGGSQVVDDLEGRGLAGPAAAVQGGPRLP